MALWQWFLWGSCNFARQWFYRLDECFWITYFQIKIYKHRWFKQIIYTHVTEGFAKQTKISWANWVKLIDCNGININSPLTMQIAWCGLTTQVVDPANIYLFNVNNRNTRTRCEICSKLTIKKPERRSGGIFTVNFEDISHLFLVFLFFTLDSKC